jgi:hypothetical protein
MDRDPVIDAWLRSSRFGSAGPHLTCDQLTGLFLVAHAGETPPDPVLQAWYQAIARHRRVADQTEPEFIRAARERGWSWQTIADALGLPSAEAAERRREALAAELTRTHPGENPQPWLPLGDPRVP